MISLNRRQFLASSAALTLASPAWPGTIQTLEARSAKAQIAPPEYPQTEIWGYDGMNPGPMIRVPQGARIQRRLLNSLSQPTAVHWHGLRLENAMDGVPGLTQDAVPPDGDFAYDFTAPDAGTYWYHSHNKSTEQVARGLYGALVVDEPDAPEVDHDIVVIVDDWRLTAKAELVQDFDSPHDWTHAGRLGNFIHGRLAPDITEVQQNQRLRLRFINAATDRVILMGFAGLTGKVVALDGMPLETPAPIQAFVMAPAQRVDFIVDVTREPGEKVVIAFRDGDKSYVLAEMAITGKASTAPCSEIAALPPNPITRLNTVSRAQIAELKMEGGAMGGLRQAVYQGKMLDTGALVDKGMVWAFNGVVGMTDTPLADIGRGETLRIPIINDTAFAHAMHIHGNHFQEVKPDGTFGPLRDTILVQAGETREIAFIGENPGKWLFHCHMLSHQAAGMKTWVNIRA